MRTREKLTLEEKFALALELLKRERSLDEIQQHYRVSHTTAYKIRNMFLEGGRAALSGERRMRQTQNLEARVDALEALIANGGDGSEPPQRSKRPGTNGNDGDPQHVRRAK
jgi:transposase